MNPAILLEYDDALARLESLARATATNRAALETSLDDDLLTTRVYGGDAFALWIRNPLSAVSAFEEVQRQALKELAGVRQELAGLERHGKRSRTTLGEKRGASDLLRRQADLTTRLERPTLALLSAARRGIARILEVSLGRMARETLDLLHACAGEAARSALLRRVESYTQLVAEARAVTSGLDLPVFPPGELTRLLSTALGLARA